MANEKLANTKVGRFCLAYICCGLDSEEDDDLTEENFASDKFDILPENCLLWKSSHVLIGLHKDRR